MKTRIEIEQHRITLKDGRAVLLRQRFPPQAKQP